MMRKIQSVRRASPWLLAATAAALLLPAAPLAQAASRGQSAKILAAELPAGVTLAKATCPQTAQAVRAATAAHPDMAVSLTEAGVLARTPRDGKLDCDCVVRIVRAGIAGAPKESSDIVQMAVSMDPQCADELNALLKGNREDGDAFKNGPDGYNTPSDFYGGFGIGFGPGFPGSPGFVGSPPSGAIALPPAAPVVTSVRPG